MSAILEVSQVYKYFGGVKANENISLNVEQGSIVGLIGPNGSGKTTLFNSIVGTHPIDKGSIKKAESISLLLVHYNSFRDKINEIISIKHDSDALIIYAPQEEGFIEKDILKNINSQRNAIIVNFRGRLLNDVLVSMITTGYKS